jgi:copper transport protein
MGVRIKRGLAALAVVGVLLALWPEPASARVVHAELLSTEPANGDVLETAPDQVLLTFNEPVSTDDGSIEVLDRDGDRLDVGDLTRPDGGRGVAASLPALDDGAYVVGWHVVSTDSHPIRGAFVFRVGEPADAAAADAEAQALMDELVAGQGGDRAVGVLYGVVRFAGFAGMVLLVGGAAFALLVWPQGMGDRRVRRVVVTGWVTTLVATILSFGFQGAYTTGEGLTGVVDASSIADVLGERTGVVWLARLGLLVLVALFALWLLTQPGERGDPRRAVQAVPGAVWAGLGVALLATISLAGHAGTGDLVPMALVLDVGHLAAVAFWLAGLALLLVVVLSTRSSDPTSSAADGGDDGEMAGVVARFSALAGWAVVVIVATGTVQAWRQIGSFEALTDTTYGRLVVVKVLLVGAVLGAAAISRRWVQQTVAARTPAAVPAAVGAGTGSAAAGAGDVEDETAAGPTVDDGDGGGGGARADDAASKARPSVGLLRRSVLAEAVGAVVVLAVTALLVNTVPAEDEVDPTFTTEVHGATLAFDVEVEPARAGTADIRIETRTHAGAPAQPDELTADLSLPERDLGPIELALEPGDAAGTYVARDAEIPYPGDWELEVQARTGQFDQDTVVAEVPVR